MSKLSDIRFFYPGGDSNPCFKFFQTEKFAKTGFKYAYRGKQLGIELGSKLSVLNINFQNFEKIEVLSHPQTIDSFLFCDVVAPSLVKTATDEEKYNYLIEMIGRLLVMISEDLGINDNLPLIDECTKFLVSRGEDVEMSFKSKTVKGISAEITFKSKQPERQIEESAFGVNLFPYNVHAFLTLTNELTGATKKVKFLDQDFSVLYYLVDVISFTGRSVSFRPSKTDRAKRELYCLGLPFEDLQDRFTFSFESLLV